MYFSANSWNLLLLSGIGLSFICPLCVLNFIRTLKGHRVSLSISRKKFASKFNGTGQGLQYHVIILLYMARKRGTNGKAGMRIPGETKRAIVVVVLVIIGLFLTLAAFGAAGIAGSD